MEFRIRGPFFNHWLTPVKQNSNDELPPPNIKEGEGGARTSVTQWYRKKSLLFFLLPPGNIALFQNRLYTCECFNEYFISEGEAWAHKSRFRDLPTGEISAPVQKIKGVIPFFLKSHFFPVRSPLEYISRDHAELKEGTFLDKTVKYHIPHSPTHHTASTLTLITPHQGKIQRAARGPPSPDHS